MGKTQQGEDGPRRGRGRPPRTEGERAELRARLTDGALAAIRRHGPGVTTAQIAAEAGVSRSAIFSTFKSKEGIAEAVAARMGEQIERQVAQRLVELEEINPVRLVETTIGGMLEATRREPEIYLFATGIIKASSTPEATLADPIFRPTLGRLRMIGKAFRPDLTSEERGILLAGVTGLVVVSIDFWWGRDSVSVERAAQMIAATVLAALMASIPPAVDSSA